MQYTLPIRVIALAGAVTAPAANAYFAVEAPKRPPALVQQFLDPSAGVPGMVIQYGAGNARSPGGFGTSNLNTALRMILPSGWTVQIRGGDPRVSWKGSAPWTVVMQGLARDTGAAIVIDWPRRQAIATLAPATPPARLARSGAPRRAAGNDAKDVDLTTRAVAPPATPGKTALLTLKIKPGPLSVQLEQWAKANGWTLIWTHPKEVMMDSTASLSGDIQQIVTDLVSGLAGTGIRLNADIRRGNRYIVIESRG